MTEFCLTVIQVRKSDPGLNFDIADQEQGRRNISEDSCFGVKRMNAEHLIHCVIEVSLAGVPSVDQHLEICGHIVIHLLFNELFLSHHFGLVFGRAKPDLLVVVKVESG